jgi:hypothetical protein
MYRRYVSQSVTAHSQKHYANGYAGDSFHIHRASRAFVTLTITSIQTKELLGLTKRVSEQSSDCLKVQTEESRELGAWFASARICEPASKNACVYCSTPLT